MVQAARGRALTGLIALVVLVVGWEITAILIGRPAVLPPPMASLQAGLGLVRQADFWSAFRVSVEALGLGCAVVLVVGIPLGVAAGASPLVEKVIEPYLSFFLSIPLAPLVPVVIAIVGLGLQAGALEIVLFALPVLLANTAAGVKETPPGLLAMARSFGARELQLMARVRFWAALPAIVTGLRLAAGRAVVGMVVSELVLASGGLGGLISADGDDFEAPALYATVAIVVLLGLVLVALVDRLGQLTTRGRG